MLSLWFSTSSTPILLDSLDAILHILMPHLDSPIPPEHISIPPDTSSQPPHLTPHNLHILHSSQSHLTPHNLHILHLTTSTSYTSQPPHLTPHNLHILHSSQPPHLTLLTTSTSYTPHNLHILHSSQPPHLTLLTITPLSFPAVSMVTLRIQELKQLKDLEESVGISRKKGAQASTAGPPPTHSNPGMGDKSSSSAAPSFQDDMVIYPATPFDTIVRCLRAFLQA